MERDAAKHKAECYKIWKDARKELRQQKKEIRSMKDEDTSRIWEKEGRYYQFWDRLPEYDQKYQDSKEDPNVVHRELRRVLIIDFEEMNHTTVRKLLTRYK